MVVGGAATCMGQNVYSANVVGYVNVTIPANGFALVANQLKGTPDNALKNVIPTAPPGTLFYKYNNGYSTFTFDEIDLAWTPNGDVTLSPGEGAFIKNVTATPMTVTFVGEVPQGDLKNAIPAGFSIRSSMVPQAGKITTDLKFPGVAGDLVYQYSGGYTTYTFDEIDLAWTPTEPTIKVGEAFFTKKVAATSWDRTFTVPQ